MISYHKGDLLESGCDIICHQVNLDGVMGAGLAYQIAEKYPNCEKEYVDLCKNTKIKLDGLVHFFAYKDNGYCYYIANCFSQNKDFSTNYEWLKQVSSIVYRFAKRFGCEVVGIPKNYGCGIAKGDWNKVKEIWKSAFESDSDIELQIWEL